MSVCLAEPSSERDRLRFRREFHTLAQLKHPAIVEAHEFGVDELMFVFKYGSMPMTLAEKSMRLFAREVLPALREVNPEPMAA